MGIMTGIRRRLCSHLCLFLDLKVLYTEYSPVNWREHFKEKKVYLISLIFLLTWTDWNWPNRNKRLCISFEEKEPIVLFIEINGRGFFLTISRVHVQTSTIIETMNSWYMKKISENCQPNFKLFLVIYHKSYW